MTSSTSEPNATPELNSDIIIKNAPLVEGYKVLGGVVLCSKLGQGGMGAVYRGRHVRLDVDVAVKIMSMPPGTSPEFQDNYVQRFVREAKTAAAVRHQNLIRVYDVNVENDINYLVMDYIDGESAGDRLKRKVAGGTPRLTEQEAIEICLGAADGLSAAHEAGIVHRDVKPDNILVDKKGGVVVADLGLAKAFGGDDISSGLSMGLSMANAAMGTPYYMAPEQTRNAKDVGPSADVWSLGVTLYQLASGALPWASDDITDVIYAIRNHELPCVTTHCEGLSEGLASIIRRATQKEPTERFNSCKEMAEALEDHLFEIRTSRASILPDTEAGETKLAVSTITPPNPQTLTLISAALVNESPIVPPEVEEPSQVEPVAEKSASSSSTAPTVMPDNVQKQKVSPAILWGIVAAVVVVILLALLLGGGGSSSTELPIAKQTAEEILEADAQAFYGTLTGLLAEDKYQDILDAIKQAGDKFADTRYATRIAKMQTKALTAQAKLDEAAKKEQARLDKIAEDNKRAKELALLEAKKQKDREFDSLLELAQLTENSNIIRELKFSLQTFNNALKHRPDNVMVKQRIAALTHRIDTFEQKLTGINKSIGDGKYQNALDMLKTLETSKIQIDNIDELRKKIATGLTPKRNMTGPLSTSFVLLEGGSFLMGSEEGGSVEKPVREVTISPIYIGQYEITRAQYAAFQDSKKALVGAMLGNHPAVELTWDEANAFCTYLTKIDGSGAVYRLPTEAEWEFAARGTEGREYPWGNTEPTTRHANVAGLKDSTGRLHEVGTLKKSKTPNSLYDMAGNAAEWCSDWYGRYPAQNEVDPKGPAKGRARVVRGGAYIFDATKARAAARSGRTPNKAAAFIGLRIVRELTQSELFALKQNK